MMMQATRYAGPALAALFVGLTCHPAAGQEADSLTPLQGDERWNDYNPAWMAGSRRILFNSRRTGKTQIYAVDIETGDVEPFIDGPGSNAGATPSPDGRHLLFSSNRDGGWQVYLRDLETGATRVFLGPQWEAGGWDWSPDGSRMAFHSPISGSTEIWLGDRDGSNIVQLTTHPADNFIPKFSPDGRWIAFVSRRNGDPDLYVLDLESRSEHRLTGQGGFEYHADWSPDGTRIAFWSGAADGDFHIFSMTPLGTDVRQLTDSPDWNWAPAYSPDGRWIAFDSRRDGRRGIYVMRSDGTEERKLTNRRRSEFVKVALEGVPEEALRRLERALSRAPEGTEFFLPAEGMAVVRAWIERGHLDAAVRLAELNHELHPGHLSVSRVLVQAWRAAGRRAPAHWFEIASSFRSLGFKAGWRLYSETRERFPDWDALSSGMLRSLAAESARTGRPLEALQLHRADVEAHPRTADAWIGYARALIRLGDRATARVAAGRALEIEPGHSEATQLVERLDAP